MSDTFREREQSEEAKYKLDEERHFKVLCRRNKLFGLWAAEALGLTRPEGEAYAKSLVMMLLDQQDPDGALERVRADLHAGGVTGVNVNDAFARCYTRAEEALHSDWHALGSDHVQVGG